MTSEVVPNQTEQIVLKPLKISIVSNVLISVLIIMLGVTILMTPMPNKRQFIGYFSLFLGCVLLWFEIHLSTANRRDLTVSSEGIRFYLFRKKKFIFISWNEIESFYVSTWRRGSQLIVKVNKPHPEAVGTMISNVNIPCEELSNKLSLLKKDFDIGLSVHPESYLRESINKSRPFRTIYLWSKFFFLLFIVAFGCYITFFPWRTFSFQNNSKLEISRLQLVGVTNSERYPSALMQVLPHSKVSLHLDGFRNGAIELNIQAKGEKPQCFLFKRKRCSWHSNDHFTLNDEFVIDLNVTSSKTCRNDDAEFSACEPKFH